jgi:hypothetical protein
MYLLKREISPYTSQDLILGCFHSREKAEDARTQYISAYRDNLKSDPWENQGYQVVDLGKNVCIVDNILEIQIQPTNKKVFVVSSFSEGFGQIIRTIHSICSSQSLAEKETQKIEKSFDNKFPEYCQIQRVAVDKLLSDEEIKPYSHIV